MVDYDEQYRDELKKRFEEATNTFNQLIAESDSPIQEAYATMQELVVLLAQVDAGIEARNEVRDELRRIISGGRPRAI